MILPMELIRVILHFNRDDYFLVSTHSFRLVSLKKFHTFPKPYIEIYELTPNDRKFYSRILLPIGSTNKAYYLSCYWCTGLQGYRTVSKHMHFFLPSSPNLPSTHSIYLHCYKFF
jgi:hypothetical protein